MNVVIFILALVSALHAEVSEQVTPVEKVTDLLVRLKDKVVEEGKQEKQWFAEFKDFCRKQENEKFWLTSKGAKTFYTLNADIEAYNAEIEAKETKVKHLHEKIDEKERTNKENNDKLKSDNEANAKELNDLDTLISQCKRAIRHLKQSDVTDTGLIELSQSKQLLDMAMRLHGSTEALEQFSALLSEPGKPHAYNFHSQAVIQLLEDLLRQFEKQRADKDHDGMNARAASELEIQNLENKIASLKNQREEYNGELEKLQQKKAEATKNKDQAKKDLDNNNDFAFHLVGCQRMKELSKSEGESDLQTFLEGKEDCDAPDQDAECIKKKDNYEQRTKKRDEEVVALTKAIDLMRGDGGKKYSSTTHMSLVDSDDKEDLDDSDLSFFQYSQNPKRKHLVKFLAMKAKSLKSATISGLLLKIKVAQDHFKSIRGMIQTLIDKLQNQLESEETQKTWCDDELKKYNGKRDHAGEKVVDLNSSIKSFEAKINELNRKIKDSNEQISEDTNSKKKELKLLQEEHKMKTQTLKDAQDGLQAVKDAIKILNKFYDGTFLLAKEPYESEYEDWRAEGSDASGKTIADMRPESDAFENKYQGAQNESKGIIGILQVIKSDYEETVENMGAALEDNKDIQKKKRDKYNNRIESDQKDVEDFEGRKSHTKEKLATDTDRLDNQTEKYKIAKSHLDKLKQYCSSGESRDQMKERRKRRKAEVEALRSGLEILREGSFLSKN